MAEIAPARGVNRTLDAALASLDKTLANGVPAESEGRHIAERMALVLQAALLVRHAPGFVADAFCATRLGGEWAANYGVLDSGTDISAIIARQAPGE
jgi:putative acyl-CoA dehydrogenase